MVKLLVFVLFLLFSTHISFGQVSLDGRNIYFDDYDFDNDYGWGGLTYNHYGNAATASVSGYRSYRLRNFANIESATVSDGLLDNRDTGKIESAYVDSSRGMLYNNGTIDTANVYNWSNGYEGFLRNMGSATIGTANVSGSSGVNAWGSISSGRLFNQDSAIVGTANISNHGVLENMDSASIDIANVDSYGELYNRGNATIDIANVGILENRGARLHNRDSASIGVANIGSNGRLHNWDSATIDTANVNGGGLSNHYDATINTVKNVSGSVGNVGSIGTANLEGGWSNNSYNGTIGTANIEGGWLNNFYATIDTVNTYSGHLSNVNGTIGTVFLNGGMVDNIGRIDSLTYTGGSYNGQQAEYRYFSFDDFGYSSQYTETIYAGTGTIGTLTVAGDSSGIDWGTVENLQFANNGAGILTVSAFADNATPGFMGIQAMSAGIAPMSFDSSPSISFAGIDAKNVDLTYGNISLDMSKFGYGDDLVASFLNAFGFDGGFSMTDLLGEMFGTSSVSGNLNSFEVAFGAESFWLINEGDFTDGWSFDNGFVTWGVFGTGDDGGNSTPEPATLVVLGLGLAGLGLARRRRK